MVFAFFLGTPLLSLVDPFEPAVLCVRCDVVDVIDLSSFSSSVSNPIFIGLMVLASSSGLASSLVCSCRLDPLLCGVGAPVSCCALAVAVTRDGVCTSVGIPVMVVVAFSFVVPLIVLAFASAVVLCTDWFDRNESNYK